MKDDRENNGGRGRNASRASREGSEEEKTKVACFPETASAAARVLSRAQSFRKNPS